MRDQYPLVINMGIFPLTHRISKFSKEPIFWYITVVSKKKQKVEESTKKELTKEPQIKNHWSFADSFMKTADSFKLLK
jgi:hypothetical protein